MVKIRSTLVELDPAPGPDLLPSHSLLLGGERGSLAAAAQFAPASAGRLVTTPIRPGVTAGEVVDLALAAASSSIAWSTSGCAAFVWGVTNMAGLPFFDLGNHAVGNDPRTPRDDSYVVPHRSGIAIGPDRAGDGWVLVSTEKNAVALSKLLQPGDVVRVYAAGNVNESTFLGTKAVGHSFIVVSNENGKIKVADNWSGGVISVHSLDVITNAYAKNGAFQSVYVSRIDSNWVAGNVDGNSLRGNGIGNWSGLRDVDAPGLIAKTPADDSSRVATDTHIKLKYDEPMDKGSGAINVYGKDGKIFESVDVNSSRVTIAGDTVTIDLKKTLASGTEYFVTMAKGVLTDLADNSAPGIAKGELNFTTTSSRRSAAQRESEDAGTAESFVFDGGILEDGHLIFPTSDGGILEGGDLIFPTSDGGPFAEAPAGAFLAPSAAPVLSEAGLLSPELAWIGETPHSF